MPRTLRPEILVRELLARELETVTLYNEMAAKARTPAVRALLERIAREEKHHIGEALDLLSTLDSVQSEALAAVGLVVGQREEPATSTDSATHSVEYRPANLTVEAASDETLLAAAMRAGVDIRHDCGGKGRCGTCRVEVASGQLTDVTEPERQHLAELLGDGWRLACQARPRSAISLTVPANTKRAEA